MHIAKLIQLCTPNCILLYLNYKQTNKKSVNWSVFIGADMSFFLISERQFGNWVEIEEVVGVVEEHMGGRPAGVLSG